MPCFHPMTVWPSREETPNGKRQPVWVENKGISDLQFTLPCGKCIGCEDDIRRDYALRWALEAKMHENTIFPTLTYDDENMPIGRNLEPAHAALFIKNLRQIIKREYPNHPPIRYVIVGEYGQVRPENPINMYTGELDLGRPHFHALIYGFTPPDLQKHSEQRGNPLYTSEFISRAWGNKGHVIIGTNVNGAATAYCAKYMKKQQNKDADPGSLTTINPQTGEILFRNKPFQRGSNRPGIGMPWFNKFHDDLWKGYITLDGKKYPIPRLFLLKLKELAYQNDKYVPHWERLSEFKRVTNDPDHPDRTPERLAVRKEVRQKKRGFWKQVNQSDFAA